MRWIGYITRNVGTAGLAVAGCFLSEAPYPESLDSITGGPAEQHRAVAGGQGGIVAAEAKGGVDGCYDGVKDGSETDVDSGGPARTSVTRGRRVALKRTAQPFLL